MKTATTKAVIAKKNHYMRLESASNFQIMKSLWFRLDVYVYGFVLGFLTGLMV